MMVYAMFAHSGCNDDLCICSHVPDDQDHCICLHDPDDNFER